MAYSSAQVLAPRSYEREESYRQPRPVFDVVEGAGLDAKVRQGVSRDFVAGLARLAVAVVFFVALGALRVGLCAQTLSALTSASELRQEILEAEALEADLKVTRSVLSNSTRIEHIATENYGMVLADEHETMWVELDVADVQADDTEDTELGDKGSVLEANIGSAEH